MRPLETCHCFCLQSFVLQNKIVDRVASVCEVVLRQSSQVKFAKMRLAGESEAANRLID